jgi:hypothetical protein
MSSRRVARDLKRISVPAISALTLLALVGCTGDGPAPTVAVTSSTSTESGPGGFTGGVGTDPAGTPVPTDDPNHLPIVSPSPNVVSPSSLQVERGRPDGQGGDAILKEAPLSEEETFWTEKQKPLGDAAWLAESKYPDDFAYGYFTDEGLRFVIGFRESAPDEVVTALKATGLPFSVEEGVGYNATEQSAVVDQVSKKLQEQASDNVVFGVGAAPELGPGVLRLLAYGDFAAAKNRSEDVSQRLALPEGYSVVIEDGGEPISATGYNRPAGTWLVDSSGTGACTSAFVAKSLSSSDLGVLTAGHCPSSLRYFSLQTGEVYPLDYRYGTVSNGDEMFLRSPNMMDAWFHYSANSGRPVLDVRNAYPSEAGICRYGRTSNINRCGTLQGSNLTVPTNFGGTYFYVQHLDLVGVASSPGDSGGPVFGGNTAMGIISGSNGTQTTFTRISTAQSATGTRVCREVVCS